MFQTCPGRGERCVAAMTDDPSESCVDGGEFFRTLRGHAALAGVPVAVAIAPTYRCNFRCVHCYAHSSGTLPPELSCEAWLGIVDQLAEAGCLFLLITGGEPLLRPDFHDIYRHAKKRGMLVTVFTNGSLVEDSHIRLFKDYPPRLVDVSLYGMSPEIHQAVTGVAGLSGTPLESVRALLREGIRVALKTVPMKANHGEFGAMRSLAASLGVSFRYDSCIMPRLDGGRTPVEQRLPAKEAVALEFSDPGRVERWKAVYARKPGARGNGPLYRCSAGRTLAFIGPDGSVHPCIAATHRKYPSATASFSDAWTRMVGDIRQLQAAKNSECVHCGKNVYCGYCPAFCHLDGGDESGVSPYLCDIGGARLSYLKGLSDGRDD